MSRQREVRMVLIEHRTIKCSRSFELVHAALMAGVTAADGLKSKAMQYEIGNPLTAERMTRHHLAAGLYAPLRVILYEEAGGQALFEYDLPSCLFGQFNDERIAAVGFELDADLESVLLAAAGP